MKLNLINSEFKVKEGSLYYKSLFIRKLYDDELKSFDDDELPDLIINHGGVIYASSNVYNPNDIFVDTDYSTDIFYKATNNLSITQVPGFCYMDIDHVKMYLPGGVRYGKYGGNHLIEFVMPTMRQSDKFDELVTANHGLVYLLPGSSLCIDFGYNDGVLCRHEIRVSKIDNKDV